MVNASCAASATMAPSTAVSLPAEIDEATSQARYENGVLELTLTKKAQAAGRKLTIQ